MPVKRSLLRFIGSGPRSEDGKPTPVARWGMGVGLGLTILVAARLAVPQPIAPREVPLPSFERATLALEIAEHRARLSSLERTPLPLEVRSVGELVRRFGTAELPPAELSPAELGRPAELEDTPELGESSDERRHVQRLIERQVQRVLVAGQVEGLLGLRALQTQRFLDAVRRWDGSMPPPQELAELSGRFASHVQPLSSPSRASLDELELAAAYRIRWTQLVGLNGHHAFAPTANDLRLHGRLRLRWAETLPVEQRRVSQLGAIRSLAEVSPDYPVAFASGVALYLAGSYAEAFDQFNAHSRQHPDGPWTLRARHHALAAATALLGTR